MKKYLPYLIGGIVLIILLVLLSWNRLTGQSNYWPGTKIACLSLGHRNAVLHIHPRLNITVDGRPEEISANIGLTAVCMSELHTHDSSGTIHAESTEISRTFTLKDFLAVWGKSLERPGYHLTMTVNGLANNSLGSLVLQDGQQIVLSYQSVPQ